MEAHLLPQRPQMACFFTLHRQPQFFSISPCKYSSTLPTCISHSPYQNSSSPCPKRALNFSSSRLLAVSPLHDSSSAKSLRETPAKSGRSRRIRPGFSKSNLDSKRVHTDLVETLGSVIINEKGVHGKTRSRLDYAIRRKKESGVSSDRTKDGNSAEEENGKLEGKAVKGGQKNQKWKRDNKSKANPTNTNLRVQFEMCSKAGDVIGAISLYDSAIKDGVKLGQYHYTMVLYLCSSAALGVVHPAKSGSRSRSIEMLFPSNNDSILNCDNEMDSEELSGSEEYQSSEEDDGCDELDVKDDIVKNKKAEILVTEEVKKYALERGLQVYERMCSENIPMTEAALTSVARMAVAMGDGDKAFDMVKQMKAMGITPKLRSYGPALSLFCSNGQADKAFEVEEHMLKNGVQPEEPELEALLRVCIEVNKPDKIYYLLHKFRTTVRSVSPSSADLIQKWFESKAAASVVGKRKWDPNTVVEMMENVGGGWHGQGWLGNGSWSVSHTIVKGDGTCQCCGEKLALIDLDPEETEKFAESVAAIALKREKNSSFQKFQRWLNYYGPFEAVVDAANVGLFSQKKFQLSKVKAVVNGIRQMLTSKKWPLVILHNRRITGPRMDEPTNRANIERWKNADALYATPTGCNDDWFWLYAAIKYKCLIVTNDEMRDHIFQLLGNDFFPRWKERHQVRFSFSEVGPVFHMPPPCSVVIQESERGHWHIPIVSKHQPEEERTWLCIRRANQDHLSSTRAWAVSEEKLPEAKEARETYTNNIRVTRKSDVLSYESILAEIQFAEKHGSLIDFQI